MNLRVVAAGRVPLAASSSARPEGGSDPSAAQTGTQRVWTPEGSLDVPTYARAALEPGMAIEGYAIVEQYDATTVVLPGHRAVVDPWMNLLIRPGGASMMSTDVDVVDARPDRERAAQRALRDGRGGAARRDVAHDPGAARRVPDDLQRRAARWSSASSARTSPR